MLFIGLLGFLGLLLDLGLLMLFVRLLGFLCLPDLGLLVVYGGVSFNFSMISRLSGKYGRTPQHTSHAMRAWRRLTCAVVCPATLTESSVGLRTASILALIQATRLLLCHIVCNCQASLEVFG